MPLLVQSYGRLRNVWLIEIGFGAHANGSGALISGRSNEFGGDRLLVAGR
jgi:hypothetical protein